MKNMKLFVSLAVVALFPVAFTSAQGLGGVVPDATGGAFGDLLANILLFTNGVLIPFVLALGFLVFVWGMFQYFIAGGSNDEAKEKGKSLMIYATLGFILIIVFWGVINLLTTSTGLNQVFDGTLIPTVTPLP